MITIQKKLSLSNDEWRAYKATLQRAAQAALASIPSLSKSEITLLLTDDAQLRALNRQFRGIDQATDVLSFAIAEVDPQSGRQYLGDVVISLERAREQAAAAGDSLEAELALLTVHGILHLCGYDHQQPTEQAQMWAMQRSILESLGFSISPPNE